MMRILSVNQPELLTEAKKGNPQAIALLLNQAFQSKGIKVKTRLQTNNLHVLLEASQLPEKPPCLQVIEKGMLRLKPENVDFIRIYGRRLGQQWPDWSESLDLKALIKPATKEPVLWSYEQESIVNQSETIPSVSYSNNLGGYYNSPTYSQNIANNTINNIDDPDDHRISTDFIVNQVPQFEQQQEKKSAKRRNKYQSLLVVSILGLAFVPLSGLLLSSPKLRFSAITQAIPNTAKFSMPTLPQNISQIAILSSKTAEDSHNNINKDTNKVANNSDTPNKPVSNIAKPTTTNTDNASVNNSNIDPNIPIDQISEIALNSLRSPIDPDMKISIRAVGDIIPGTNYPYSKLPNDKNAIFADVKALLTDADLTFGNFESTMTTYPKSAKSMGSGRVFAFRTPPDYKDIFTQAGFDVLSVANNHSYDFYEKGFNDTMANFRSIGIEAVGKKNEIVYKTIKGVKFGFVAFSNYNYHNVMQETATVKKLVAEADKNADIVIVSVHAGAEGTGALRVKNKNEYFYGEDRGNLVLFARSAIDTGADLVFGHGPHVPRALELYKDKLVAYSLGNFVGYRTLSTASELGYSLVLEVEVNPQGDFV
ncbi:MAG: CapA family protein, partial [Microcoleaceae cyanobacterium]